MSLPGLGLEEPEEIQTVEAIEYTLPKESEWRFEVAVGKYLQFKLLTGTAEISGTELVPQAPYTFSGAKAAVFSWHGCTFEVSGDAPTSEYTAEETPMSEYVNVHFALEAVREQAARTAVGGREGPRVLILGPDNAGKSTLAKILTGYAVRSHRAPVVVNLDVREGLMSVPGTLTATVFKTLVDVEEGWGTAPMSGPNATIPVKLPLVYFHGGGGGGGGGMSLEGRDARVYKAQVRRVALAVAGRLAQDPEARESGVIIDTPGVLAAGTKSPVGYEIVQDVVSEFAVSVIVCLGSERLYSDMVRKFDRQPTSSARGAAVGEVISVIKLSKSGGCVDRDEAFMQAFRAAQIRSYFYGNPKLSAGIALQPRQQQVDFGSLTVWRRIGPATETSGGSGGIYDEEDEFLPGGIEDDGGAGSSRVALPDSQVYERLTSPVAAMKNSVLAVMNCEPEAEQDAIRDASVMGFLYVTDVDENRGRVSLLSPVAGRVPDRAIVWAGWPVAAQGMEKA